MKEIYRNVSLLTERKKRKIIFIIFLFLILSLVEVLGLGLIPVVFMKGIGGQNIVFPEIFGLSVLSVTAVELAVLVVIIYFFKAIIYSFSQYKVNQFVFQMMHNNRMRIVDSVIDNAYLKIRNIAVSDHVNMIQLHVNSAANGYLIPIFQILSNLIIVFSLFFFLLFVSFEITLMSAGVVGLVSLIYYKKIKGCSYDIGKEISQANRNIIDLIKSINQGWRVIKSLGSESYVKSKINVESRRLSQSKLHQSFINFIPKPLFEVVLVAFVVLSFVYLVNSESKTENVIGLMSLLGVSAIRLVQITATIMSDVSRIRGVQHHVEALIFEMKALDSWDYQAPVKINGVGFSHSKKLSLILENITFGYPNAKKEIVQNLSLSAKAGDIIGLVGDSGVGKSTLVNIIMGFIPIDEGRILLSGVKIGEEVLIENSSYMPQDSVIFNDTLFNNLALGNTSVTREYAEDALIALNVLSKKNTTNELTLDSQVGEDGPTLSGGESQRIALARTYAHKSSIVVLDEPTSSLDERNEKIVMGYIKKHREFRITFVVSHRSNMLDGCDVVYRFTSDGLENLKIAEEVVRS